MSPQGRRHRAFIDNLTHLLDVGLAGRAIVSVRMPIVLPDDTEPEPDVQILRRRSVPYKDREAFAEDALLLIEVAESSLVYERSTKVRRELLRGRHRALRHLWDGVGAAAVARGHERQRGRRSGISEDGGVTTTRPMSN